MILLTIGRLTWLYIFIPNSAHTVENGMLDLHRTNLSEEGTIQLKGEWMYYPSVFVNPKGTQDNELPFTYVTVPAKGDQIEEHSYGTYRLKIIVNREDGDYAIKVPAIPTANALYVNGQLLYESGIVGTNKGMHKGKNEPYLVTFSEQSQELDIILHVSNFDTDQSISINKHVHFGTATNMTKRQGIADLSFIAVSVILAIHAIYSLLIYLLIFRQKVVLLYVFGFLMPLLDDVFAYEQSLFDFLNLGYIWTTKISNSIFLLSAFFYMQFMRTLLTQYRYHSIFNWLNGLYVICLLLILLLPLNWYDTTSIFLYLLYFISFISVAYFAFKKFVNNQRESVFLVITLLTVSHGLTWGFIKAAFMLDLPYYPFDYLTAILALASFWFKRFYENTKQISTLVTELKQADIEKDEFITNNAEKLWDPLNKMFTIVQSVHDNEQNSLSVRDRKQIKELIDIGRTIKFTLMDITDFSRLKNGSLQLDITNVHIHAIVTGTVDMIKFMFDEKEMTVSIVPPTTALYTAADEQRLIQILFNLLYNTIKYTPTKEMTIRTDLHNDMVVMTIHTPELVTLESQGQSSDDSESDFGEELRLGFIIAQQLIELHDGSLNIESSEENGTLYRIMLPLATQCEVNREEEILLSNTAIQQMDTLNHAISHSQKSTNCMILVINYDPLNLRVIRHIFSSEECEVVTTTSSKEALELIEQFEWDLVIVDAMMPDISGYSVVQKIRDRFSFIELPVILLTARDTTEESYAGFAYGINDYVKKPINQLELKTRSRMLLNMKQYFNEKLQMETAWLQAQIQPHFLFNTLNTIATLSEIDYDRMVELMTHFGDYLRASFDSRNLQRVIPIQEELKLISSYLFIEQQRFGDLLHVEWDVDEKIIVDIPPISIQTLVENAIRHGVTKQDSGGTIWITVKDQADYVEISVRDNGVGMNPETVALLLDDTILLGKGVGVRNTNQRLKKIFGYGLEIESKLGVGTTFTMKIPKN